jgi:hypothetical protein
VSPYAGRRHGKFTWQSRHLWQQSGVTNLVHRDAMNLGQPALAVGPPPVLVVEALSPLVADEDPQHGVSGPLL